MLSFTAADHARVASGDLTVTWRLWKYPHVKAGKVYSTGFGHVFIEDVRQLSAALVTDADAAEAGLPDARALIDLARSHTGAEVDAETLLYCVRFHYLHEAPARPELSLDEIAARLQRLDRASPLGPWTVAVLRLIEANPTVVARLLAPELGWPTPEIKARVRKLKALGLTISLGVGYELSELGQRYLDSLDAWSEAHAS